MKRKVLVLVKSNSRKIGFEARADGSFSAAVKEPPVKGAANTSVARLIATHFNVPIRSVRLVTGHTGKKKLFEVEDADL
ncbi:MAG: DUF167 domain-containing protein [Nitrospirae bacterium]|nr:DUF167 domain-containing protein [Candidatus Troglogloeales bacterium]MBI3598492.1 DUF167 domain-containing protein [Candidatus Troglogloeales bacterium]